MLAFSIPIIPLAISVILRVSFIMVVINLTLSHHINNTRYLLNLP